MIKVIVKFQCKILLTAEKEKKTHTQNSKSSAIRKQVKPMKRISIENTQIQYLYRRKVNEAKNYEFSGEARSFL